MTEIERLRAQNEMLVAQLRLMDSILHVYESALMHAGVQQSTLQKMKDKAKKELF